MGGEGGVAAAGGANIKMRILEKTRSLSRGRA